MSTKLQKFLANELAGAFLLTLTVSAVIRVLLFWRFKLPLPDTAEEVLLDLIIFLGTSVATLGRKLWAIRDLIKTLLRIYDHTEPGARRLWAAVLTIQIEGNLRDTFDAAFSVSGADLSIVEVDRIAQLCFSSGNGVYNGTDSNPPGIFITKYPHYLAYHEKNLKKKNQSGIRVLIVSEDALDQDFQNRRSDFEGFKRWHDDNCIDLLQVDPIRAEELKGWHSLLSTDIGIWDKDLAIIFSQIGTASPKLKLYICPRTSPRFEQCQEYFLALLDNSNSIQVLQNRIVVRQMSLNDRNQNKDRVRRQWQE